ncbi:MAG TPA: hypothetical protein DGH68_07645 [Bacteroidetes bacterium]|jgi:hypothetical protein|nr:hypothetical protein [Bacteroidota bacterium]
MSFVFKPSDTRKIGKLLGVTPRVSGAMQRFEMGGKDGKYRLALELYPNIRIGDRRGNLVSVYTETAHLQLHFCSGYVVSEMLGEVTFIGEHEGRLSGLIVEKQGGCSLYANVDRSLLSGDFTHLGPEVMLSGIALSLTDTILGEPKPAVAKKNRGTKKVRVR